MVLKHLEVLCREDTTDAKLHPQVYYKVKCVWIVGSKEEW